VENRFRLTGRLRVSRLWSRGDSTKPLIPSTCNSSAGAEENLDTKGSDGSPRGCRPDLSKIRLTHPIHRSHAGPFRWSSVGQPDPSTATPYTARGTTPSRPPRALHSALRSELFFRLPTKNLYNDCSPKPDVGCGSIHKTPQPDIVHQSQHQ